MTTEQPSTSIPVVTKQLSISGRVQGVGYRYSFYHQAQEIGISGWCRNTADGRVEALVQGSPSQIEAIIQWCHQGPRHARVDDVAIIDTTDAQEILAGFEVRP